MNMQVTKTYKIPFNESNWALHITRNGDEVDLALHYKGKAYPAHISTIPLAEISTLLEGILEED